MGSPSDFTAAHEEFSKNPEIPHKRLINRATETTVGFAASMNIKNTQKLMKPQYALCFLGHFCQSSVPAMTSPTMHNSLKNRSLPYKSPFEGLLCVVRRKTVPVVRNDAAEKASEKM